MNILGDYRLILGSSSPRRKQILTEAGIPFIQKVIDVEENFPDSMASEEVPAYLAKVKSEPFLSSLEKRDILLTSDCLVICEGRILGKPNDYEEAMSMLQLLSGKSHKVLTGVCLTHIDLQRQFTVTSIVHFNSLEQDEISYYLDNYKPYDKAGSYAIQEWIGHCKISAIEGSYLNIVGLPMEAVYENLKTFIQELNE